MPASFLPRPRPTVLFLVLGLVACQPSDPPLPNIIYMLADDLGYGELGSYGQTKIRTPFLDQLAAQGIRFSQHYSGSPVCAPSRGTLLTGFHTGHSQVRDNFELGGWIDSEERGQMSLDPGTYTIGRMLRRVCHGRHRQVGPRGAGLPGRAQPARIRLLLRILGPEAGAQLLPDALVAKR